MKLTSKVGVLAMAAIFIAAGCTPRRRDSQPVPDGDTIEVEISARPLYNTVVEPEPFNDLDSLQPSDPIQ